MLFPLKKLFFNISFNSCLLLILFIGLQNNFNKSKVNFLIDETIEMPNGFIFGMSFISGSLFGGLLPLRFNHKE